MTAPWICTECGKLWVTSYMPEYPELCPYCKRKTVIVDDKFDQRYIRGDG